MSARAWTLFAAVSVIWGLPYLLIKVAIEGGMPPLSIAALRVALAALALLALARRAGSLGSLRGRWRWLAIFAVVEVALPFPLISAGETRIESSTAAILIATAPLVAAVLALRLEPEERLGGARLAGLVVGLAGVAALVGVHVETGGGELLGILAVLLAACGYAAGAMILKHRLGGLDPVAAMAATMAIAAVPLAPPLALTLPGAEVSGGALLAVLALGLVPTAAGMVLMAMLVREAGPGRSLVVTYLNPVVAVLLGVVFLGENPGAGVFAGLALILLGSWLSTEGRLPWLARRPSERPTE
ncbi:MAG: DMT family transporter [Solirubrobacterales bacterium]